MNVKDERSREIIRHAAAEFFQHESSGSALITVTRVDISEDAKRATVMLSVIPEGFEEQVLEFAKRKRSDLRTHLKKHTKLPRIPHVEVALDIGEKNRQRIEELGSM